MCGLYILVGKQGGDVGFKVGSRRLQRRRPGGSERRRRGYQRPVHGIISDCVRRSYALVDICIPVCLAGVEQRSPYFRLDARLLREGTWRRAPCLTRGGDRGRFIVTERHSGRYCHGVEYRVTPHVERIFSAKHGRANGGHKMSETERDSLWVLRTESDLLLEQLL